MTTTPDQPPAVEPGDDPTSAGAPGADDEAPDAAEGSTAEPSAAADDADVVADVPGAGDDARGSVGEPVEGGVADEGVESAAVTDGHEPGTEVAEPAVAGPEAPAAATEPEAGEPPVEPVVEPAAEEAGAAVPAAAEPTADRPEAVGDRTGVADHAADEAAAARAEVAEPTEETGVADHAAEDPAAVGADDEPGDADAAPAEVGQEPAEPSEPARTDPAPGTADAPTSAPADAPATGDDDVDSLHDLALHALASAQQAAPAGPKTVVPEPADPPAPATTVDAGPAPAPAAPELFAPPSAAPAYDPDATEVLPAAGHPDVTEVLPPLPAPPLPAPAPGPAWSSTAQHQPQATWGAFPPVGAPQQAPRGPVAAGQHDYAAQAAYAGWAPATPADPGVRRRRLLLVGGGVLALAVLTAGAFGLSRVVGDRGWEPLAGDVPEARTANAVQLVLGTCVEELPEDGDVGSVRVVPCSGEHGAQVVGRTDFAEKGIWPGDDAARQRVAHVCGQEQLGAAARESESAAGLVYVVWAPSEASWEDGDRVGLCLASGEQPLTGSLLD